jgi:transposase
MPGCCVICCCAANYPRAGSRQRTFAKLRTTVRLRKVLVNDRTAWRRRIHAQLFHHGLCVPPSLASAAGRAYLDQAKLPAAARQVVEISLRSIDHIDAELDRIDAVLIPLARRLPGCQVLMSQWGIGEILAVTILAELGDCRRFSSSRQAVRFVGLDVSVEDSDGKRSRGHLTRQGPPVLRWALYEAAGSAWRVAFPDHAYYLAAKERIGIKRARVSVSRRILRRVHHELKNVGAQATAEAA